VLTGAADARAGVGAGAGAGPGRGAGGPSPLIAVQPPTRYYFCQTPETPEPLNKYIFLRVLILYARDQSISYTVVMHTYLEVLNRLLCVSVTLCPTTYLW